uniref:Uncharacterized protein n=1 Tax=Globodera pallida TaxID=36090 RepID=A0A183C8M0_GLOPA
MDPQRHSKCTSLSTPSQSLNITQGVLCGPGDQRQLQQQQQNGFNSAGGEEPIWKRAIGSPPPAVMLLNETGTNIEPELPSCCEQKLQETVTLKAKLQ